MLGRISGRMLSNLTLTSGQSEPDGPQGVGSSRTRLFYCRDASDLFLSPSPPLSLPPSLPPFLPSFLPSSLPPTHPPSHPPTLTLPLYSLNFLPPHPSLPPMPRWGWGWTGLRVGLSKSAPETERQRAKEWQLVSRGREWAAPPPPPFHPRNPIPSFSQGPPGQVPRIASERPCWGPGPRPAEAAAGRSTGGGPDIESTRRTRRARRHAARARRRDPPGSRAETRSSLSRRRRCLRVAELAPTDASESRRGRRLMSLGRDSDAADAGRSSTRDYREANWMGAYPPSGCGRGDNPRRRPRASASSTRVGNPGRGLAGAREGEELRSRGGGGIGSGGSGCDNINALSKKF